MKEKDKKVTFKHQFIFAICLACFGCILLAVSFVVPPLGVIEASVLAAVGEIFTFSGSVLGIDANYKLKTLKYREKEE